MADLVMAAPLEFRHPTPNRADEFTVDTSTAQKIYRGQPVIIDPSVDTINLRGWVAATTLVLGTDVFIGIAQHDISVQAGDLESITKLKVITHGEIGLKMPGFTDADIGKFVSFSDNNTLVVAAAATNRLPCGRIRRVANGFVYVELTGPTVI